MTSLFYLTVAFVMSNPAALDRPLYIYYSPTFESKASCYGYARANATAIFRNAVSRMRSAVPLQPETIYCLSTEEIQNIYTYSQNLHKKEI